jgi:hypothetical protein
VEKGWKTPARRAFLKRVASQYQQASAPHKKQILAHLPDIIAALEQHGHLHLSEENRRILLSMSAATADRLLRFQCSSGLKSLSATKAGPLLKHQIPIRTFADWNEAQPGFLEVERARALRPYSEGEFSLHVDADGCGHRVDRVLAAAQPWTRGGAGRLATRSHAHPFSRPRD